MDNIVDKQIIEQIIENVDDTLDNEIPEELLNEYIIGIDLGTTNTCAGIWRNGNVEIIPTRTGKRTLPSVVAYTKYNRYIGDDAKNQKEFNPQNVFFEVKRLIGRKMNDKSVQNELEFFPYKITGDKYDNINLVPNLDNDKIYTPEEISAAILTEVRQMASEYLGKKITKCIITVPAHFNDGQRQATKDASEIAGLECIRIINEPIAAALAYGLYQRSQYEYKQRIEKKQQNINNSESDSTSDVDTETDSKSSSESDEYSESNSTCSDYSNDSNDSNNSDESDESYKHIIVYDFGGGTLDVCLLRIQNGIFTVLASSGKTRMGGSDFDTRLLSFCMSVFKKQYGYKDLNELPTISLQKLRLACESAKKLLSTVLKTRIAIKNFYNGKDLNMVITRFEFEKMCTDLFLEILDPVSDTLNLADMMPSDIDEIITVGGMTCMPKIRELLKQRFGKEPNCTINPDEAVAIGAAIQGYLLSHKDDPFSDSIQLLNSVSLSLGVEADGGQMSVVIPRGELIPVSKSRDYTTDKDYTSSVIIKVYEGERSIAEEKGNFFVGEFELCGIEMAPRGIPEIEVTFSVDANGIITVSAQNKKTFDSSAMTVTSNKGRLTKEQIAALIEEAQDYEYHDAIEKRKKSMYNEIDDLCSNIMYNLDKKELKLSQTDRDIIIKDVDGVLFWLKEKSTKDRDDDEYLHVIKILKDKYGVLILHGHIETNELKDCEEKGNEHVVTVYGNDDDDDNEGNRIFEKLEDEEKGYKGMSDAQKSELKELRQGVFDLSHSILDIIDSNNIKISNEHATELKEFINDALMWMHIHEKPTVLEYKNKINSINDICDKIFKFYQDEGVEVFKSNEISNAIKNPRDELDNLCIIIKLLIEDKKIPLDKKELTPLYNCVCEILDWIFENDVIIEKQKIAKISQEKIDEKISAYHEECKNKINIVNNESEIVNQKIHGLDLEKFESTIKTSTSDDIILTGYNENDTNIDISNNTQGTSILNIMKRKQKFEIQDMISNAVDAVESNDDTHLEPDHNILNIDDISSNSV